MSYFFDRHDRFEILEDSFVYCQKNKGLKIYAFVFMLNHLHFIGDAKDMIEIIRDMKKFLSTQFKKSILATEPNVLTLFEINNSFCFWEKSNCPKIIETHNYFEQKRDYIHNNPVYKGYVYEPEDWKWSSACKYPSRIVIEQF